MSRWGQIDGSVLEPEAPSDERLTWNSRRHFHSHGTLDVPAYAARLPANLGFPTAERHDRTISAPRSCRKSQMGSGVLSGDDSA